MLLVAPGQLRAHMTFCPITRRAAIALISFGSTSCLTRALAYESSGMDAQPYFTNVRRAIESLERLGAPIERRDSDVITSLAADQDATAVPAAEAILDKYTLATLRIAPEGSVSIGEGGAPRVLLEQGWRMFLVRIENATGNGLSILFPGIPRSVNQMAIGSGAHRPYLPDTVNMAPLVEKMWLSAEVFGATLTRFGRTEVPTIQLSGFPREYHVLQLFSRDAGARVAEFTLRTHNAKTFWYGGASKEFDFRCLSTREITLRVRDADGLGCMAALTVKDAYGRIYPPLAMRLAPDMAFHEHIYRADGEAIRLPDGDYTLESWRGPEYLRLSQEVHVEASTTAIGVQLRRWIDPRRWGWYSGDIHIHAAGCAHYEVPTEGVSPETMIRHVRGEALSIGEVLTWGPSWYYQKQFFSGHVRTPVATLEHPSLQVANNAHWETQATPKDDESLLRYDVEVAGFPSSISGHPILLRLRDQDYPGTKVIEDWPSWNLPILQWARAQGAVVGYAHCALGMTSPSSELPNYNIPAFDSIGTNEAIVDVTHGALDFLAGCNLFPVAELNAWYHMLNCGFRVAFAGETDYPCVTGERPGVGRTYVQLQTLPRDDVGYDSWVSALQQGRVYCGDGRSHFLDFNVEGHRAGDEFRAKRNTRAHIRATVAAWLDVRPAGEVGHPSPSAGERWHLEDARIDNTRTVSVELIVNGAAVARMAIEADGVPRNIQFRFMLERSSWIALRILPSCHTSPAYVRIDDRPIRASKRSADWCRRCVDKLWQVKAPFIRESEREAAAKAYDYARRMYDSIANESDRE